MMSLPLLNLSVITAVYHILPHFVPVRNQA
jgi:hypothetical protein